MLDEALRESSKSVIDEVAGIVREFSDRVDERFDTVEARLHNVETRLDHVEAGLADLNAKYDHLITTSDKFLKRLDDKEQEDAARDAPPGAARPLDAPGGRALGDGAAVGIKSGSGRTTVRLRATSRPPQQLIDLIKEVRIPLDAVHQC